MNNIYVSANRPISDILGDEIVIGKLKPGAKLDEVTLSKKFNVSRTPIREALRILSTSGLVELIPNKGAYVAKISIARLVEMFEVAAHLEGICGRLSARRISSELSKALQEKHMECQRAQETGNSDEYYYYNEQFHDVIYNSSQNTFLIEQVGQLRKRLQPYRRMQLRVPQRMKNSIDEHQEIVNAIISGDENKAELILRNHVLIQGERFNDFVTMVSKEFQLASSEN